MKVKNLKSFYFVENLKNFKKHKKILLDLISKMPDSQYSTDIDQIKKTDWHLPKDHKREYLTYFYSIVDGYLRELIDFMCVNKCEVYNGWFQQYSKNSSHEWHTHGHCHFSSVFYLELPNNTYKTQIYDFKGGILDVDVKEGDILTFPAYYNHKSKIINNNDRKTIISFNINFLNSNIKKIEKKINKNKKIFNS